VCTSIILFRKGHNWPFILATNRDEAFNRPSLSPGRHWKKQPYIIGGLDKIAGGTWCAINDYGILACIHNRGTDKQKTSLKSRGEIILKILRGKNINEVISLFKRLKLSNYNGFNLLLTDKKNAFWIKHLPINKNYILKKIPKGYSILTNSDLNNLKDKKIKYYLEIIKNYKINEPDKSLNKLENLLRNNQIKGQKKINDSICFNINDYYGTVSSIIICLNKNYNSTIFKYTDGPPNKDIYKNLNLI